MRRHVSTSGILTLGILTLAAIVLAMASGPATTTAAGRRAASSAVRAGTARTWSMWGNGPTRTRVGPNVGLPAGKPLWTVREMTAQFGDLLEYPPSIATGKLFYATNGGGQGGEVVARRLSDGTELWRYRVVGGGQFASQPTISGSVVFIGTMKPHRGRGDAHYVPAMLALAVSSTNVDGTVLWKDALGHGIESSPLVLGSRLYFATQDGWLYCLDASSGRRLWSRSLGSKTTASPASDGRGHVVEATYGGLVWALDAKTGALRWKTALRAQFYGTPAVAGGRVIVASKSNGRIYSLAATTGKVQWSYMANQGFYASPAIANNTVFIGSKFRGFWAIGLSNGKPKWPKRFFAGPIFGSATVLGGNVYFSTLPAHGKSKGKTFALNARTGKTVWSFPDGYYSPITATGSAILLTGHNTVYDFRPRS